MKIIEKINELLGILDEESPYERARWRLDSFRSKWSGTRLTTMIKGFKDEAKHAQQKLKSM